jgi:hypothetical protein
MDSVILQRLTREMALVLGLLALSLGNSALAWEAPTGVLVAQESEAGDAYDPFSDYSEFEATEEEEADLNFFKNGRFFTLGFIGGYRMMTETLGDIYGDAYTVGLFLSYFFDLRFAMQMQFVSGSHAIKFNSPNTGTGVSGTASLTAIGINLKYFINTQNVTKGLADLNPYFLGGFSQVYRTATVSGEEAFSKEGALGFEFGGGMEFPIMRNKMYLGTQLTYQLVSFKDENREIVLADGPTNIFPTGDAINANIILGVNF